MDIQSRTANVTNLKEDLQLVKERKKDVNKIERDNDDIKSEYFKERC